MPRWAMRGEWSESRFYRSIRVGSLRRHRGHRTLRLRDPRQHGDRNRQRPSVRRIAYDCGSVVFSGATRSVCASAFDSSAPAAIAKRSELVLEVQVSHAAVRCGSLRSKARPISAEAKDTCGAWLS